MVLEGCIRGGSTSAIGSAAVEDVRRYGMVGEEWVSVSLSEEDVSLSSEPASSQYAVHSGKCRRDGAVAGIVRRAKERGGRGESVWMGIGGDEVPLITVGDGC